MQYKRYNWKALNNLQKGTYGEFFAKMEFTMYGYDVFTSEVDHRGVDFVARSPAGIYYEVQVKTVTGRNYAFVYKAKFRKAKHFLVTLIRYQQGASPLLYLFRGTDWNKKQALFVYHPYGEGKISKPEYGLNLSKKNDPILQEYLFDKRIAEI